VVLVGTHTAKSGGTNDSEIVCTKEREEITVKDRFGLKCTKNNERAKNKI
jgi:hypothetical protein